MGGKARQIPGAQLISANNLGDFATGGSIGLATATVDIWGCLYVTQTTAGQSITIPSPTDTTAGRILVFGNKGTQSATVTTLAALALAANAWTIAVWDGAAWRKIS